LALQRISADAGARCHATTRQALPQGVEPCWLLYGRPYLKSFRLIFTRESSYCFQRVLAIAILSVRLSVCHTGGSVENGAR